MLFRSLPPQGKTPAIFFSPLSIFKFQSTSPTGEDTRLRKNNRPHWHISIHFPHRGRHSYGGNGWVTSTIFQSTSPTGEDTSGKEMSSNARIFQSTSPTGEDTQGGAARQLHYPFQSTSPTGEDTSPSSKTPLPRQHFNPLPPQGKTPR